MTALIVVSALTVLALAGWKGYRQYRKTRMFAQYAAPYTASAFTEAAPQYGEHTVTLKLPSLEPMFQFSCDMLIRYRSDKDIPNKQSPHQIAEWLVYERARRISAGYPLNSKDLLKTELDIELREPTTELGRLLDVRAQCSSASVDEEQLRLVDEVARRKYTLEVENHLMDAYKTRVEQLASVFADPRKAALWWLARHPDRITELPEKFELMLVIDQYLNVREGSGRTPVSASSDPVHRSVGVDLEEFLASADVSSKAAVGTLLGNAYERLGRIDLAQRARMLTDARESMLEYEQRTAASP